MPKLKHHGLSRYRFKDNPIEELFAKLWEGQNDCGGSFGTLAYLLDPEHQHSPREPTQEQATVAATVIQWLGSPVGQFFLLSAKIETVMGHQNELAYRTIIRVLVDTIHDKELAGEFPYEVLVMAANMLDLDTKKRKSDE
ncbi:MAG: hypothetical protein OK454_03380 [Thaumarchaeota archaeon]|nr:hypothetical protein [Nitrososphaerota archaeon]